MGVDELDADSGRLQAFHRLRLSRAEHNAFCVTNQTTMKDCYCASGEGVVGLECLPTRHTYQLTIEYRSPCVTGTDFVGSLRKECDHRAYFNR